MPIKKQLILKEVQEQKIKIKMETTKKIIVKLSNEMILYIKLILNNLNLLISWIYVNYLFKWYSQECLYLNLLN